MMAAYWTYPPWVVRTLAVHHVRIERIASRIRADENRAVAAAELELYYGV